MSIFDRIKKRLFGDDSVAQKPAHQPQTTSASAGSVPTSPSTKPATPAPKMAGAAPEPAASTATPSASKPAAAPVDVAAIMDAAVAKNGQKLDWRHSIVDMMKALDMDSSLGERKELAAELGYTGDTGDSATMNVWLHKALMKKLSENGGNVPAELLS